MGRALLRVCSTHTWCPACSLLTMSCVSSVAVPPPPAGAATACRLPPAACSLQPAAARQPAYRIYRGSAATTDPITGTVRPYRTADVLATMLATPWLGQWLLAAARAPFVVTTF